jgi:CRISPR type III-B/RAMP module-associated protein Cmr3
LFTAGCSIGESFNGYNDDYGDLLSISPLFLTDNTGVPLLPAPACINKEQQNLQLSFGNSASSFVNGRWQRYAVETPAYKAKEGLAKGWLNSKSGAFVADDNIFEVRDHIGINKTKRIEQQTDEGAFYKQQFISLKNGYAFTFYAVVNENVDIEKLPSVLHFGGERRSFHIHYKEADNHAWDKLKAETTQYYEAYANDQCCIMLLSDSYTESMESLNSLLKFAIINEQPFRNIITPKSAENFGSFTQQPAVDSKQLYKADVKWLLKKGSVLYYEKEKKETIEELLTYPAYKNIGYNHYLIFNT